MTMTPPNESSHGKLPNDLAQIQVVWSYELLKYLRSWRIIASIAIVIAMLALLYALPPALGQPYSGTDENRKVWIESFEKLNIAFPLGPQPQSFGALNRSIIDSDTVQLFVNGTPYPSNNGANWLFIQLAFADELPSFMGGSFKLNAVIFMENLTGSSVTATYDWTTSQEDFSFMFLSFANILVVVCATFFGADALVGEFQNRTGYLIFPNPLKREVLYIGKFCASMTAGILIVVMFYAGMAALSYIAVDGVDDDFVASLLFALEFLLAATAVGYLISSVLKGTTGATVLTFLLFIIIMPIVDGVSIFAGSKIEASLTFASSAMMYIIMDPYPIDTSNDMYGFTVHSYYPTPSTAAIVMMAYAVIAIAISLFLFRRKQLTG